jgi:hypothetical protein
MRVSHIGKHESICIDDPEVEARTRKCFDAASDTVFLPSRTRYESVARSEFENVPSGGSLMRMLGIPTWNELAPWVGMLPHSERLSYSLNALRELSVDLHDGEVGPSTIEWMAHRSPGALSNAHLRELLGVWEDVLAAAGLRHEGLDYYRSEGKAPPNWDAPTPDGERGDEIEHLHTLKGYRQYSQVYRDLNTGQLHARTFTELR